MDTLNSSITTHNVSVASKLDAAQKKAHPNSSNERESGGCSDNSNTTSTNHLVASFFTSSLVLTSSNVSNIT